MLDTLIRDISARWGLADQGRPLVQMLVAYISNPATEGLPGFLEKFRKAGWGGMVNTWVDNNDLPEMPTTAQIETVLGANDGLLSRASTRLGLSYDKVSAAVAGLLPLLVGRMTPDGTIPATLPAELVPFAQSGKALLGQADGGSRVAHIATGRFGFGAADDMAPAASVGRTSGSKWLPWVLGALFVVFSVSYCSQTKVSLTGTPVAETRLEPAVPAEPPATVMPVAPVIDVVPSAAPATPEPFTASDSAK